MAKRNLEVQVSQLKSLIQELRDCGIVEVASNLFRTNLPCVKIKKKKKNQSGKILFSRDC